MDKRLFFTSTLRNRDPIGEVLERFLPKSGYILEIASGSGEHGVTFQQRFPSLQWQTSDPEASYRESISGWIDHEGLSQIMPQPIDIDVRERPWSLPSTIQSNIKAIVCINMIHISKWECTQALFAEAKEYLYKHHFLILYGPFKRAGNHTSKSNELFEQSLKQQNPNWGIRELEEVEEVGKDNDFILEVIIQMPANNLMIIFKKR